MVFPKKFAITHTFKSNDDCYFYFYSSCTKGDDCPYRHCKEALGTETVCTLWEEGRCFRANCKFRHMKSRVNRSQISCYWENQPGGCRKPHCVFFHRKLKNGTLKPADNQNLILPVADEKTSPVPTINVPEIKIAKPVPIVARSESSFDETDEGIHSPVEPFVVSFDENEESDSESVSSTPVKSNDSKLVNGKNNLVKSSDKSVEKSLDFGIKSLEQIRLEKLHKESVNFYKTDDLPDKGIENFFHDAKQTSSLPDESVHPEYEVPSLEEYKLQRCLEMEPKYPLTSVEFVPLQPVSSMDGEQIAQDKEISHVPLKQENDLRSFLKNAKKRTLGNNFSTDEVPKKVASYKKNSNSADDTLDFKIKTLDEIRKEKELKKNVSSIENGSSGVTSQDSNVNHQNQPTNKNQSTTFRKLKINRRSEDSTTDSAKRVKRRNESLDNGTTNAKILKLDLPVNGVQLNDDQPENSSEKTMLENLQKFENDSSCEMSSPKQDDSKTVSQTDETVESNDSKKESVISNNSLKSSLNSAESSLLSTEADSSTKSDVDFCDASTKQMSAESIDVNSRTSPTVSSARESENVDRSSSIDELDHFLKDTDVDMDDLDETVDAGEDDIMLKINELLDS